MILINVLPPEFRKEALGRGAALSKQRIATAGAILFVAVAVIFYVQYLFGIKTLKGLEGRWLSLQGDLGRVEQIRTEMELGSKAERGVIESHILSPHRTTAVLSSISRAIPDTIWLVELKFTRRPTENTVLVKGVSFASRERSSVQEIESYLRSLKAEFPADTEVVLTTSRQRKERTELTLFTAVFRWLGSSPIS